MEEIKQTGWYAEQRSGQWTMHTGDERVEFPMAFHELVHGLADNPAFQKQTGSYYFSFFRQPHGVTHIVQCFGIDANHMAGQIACTSTKRSSAVGSYAESPAAVGSPNLAHALKAPVSRIIGLTELLLASEKVAGEDRRLVSYIEESAKKLRQLFGRVLEQSAPGLSNELISPVIAQSMSQFIQLHATEPSSASVAYIEAKAGSNDHIAIHGLASVARLFTDEQGLLSVPAGLAALHDAFQADALVFMGCEDGSIELCICQQPVYSAAE